MSVTLKGKSLKGTVGNQRSIQVTAKPRGNDGISPEITVQEIENGHRVSMKDINGTSIFDVMNGAKGDKGDPGYTPVKGVDYFDGEKGQDGYTPVKGVDYHDGEKGNDGYTPVKGIDYFDGKDGRDGQDGKDGVNGKDGTSVSISSITESDEDGGENVVTFSDGKTLTVKNGNKGDDGEGGGGNSVYFSEEEPTDAKTGDFWYDESEGESEEANADYIPVPQSANIGQTIVVKEVDANGKPTKWEAVYLPSGGGGGSFDSNFIIIKELSYDEEEGSSTFDKTAAEINNAMWNEGKTPILSLWGAMYTLLGSNDEAVTFSNVSYNINGGKVELWFSSVTIDNEGVGYYNDAKCELQNLLS